MSSTGELGRGGKGSQSDRRAELSLFSTYFGNASSASTSGFYAQIAYGNKPGVVSCDELRQDDLKPQPTSATSELFLCDR